MTNLQNERTEKLIYLGFQELLSKKLFSKITINDISEASMINRSTFYLHFLDKYDLLAKFLQNKGADTELNIEDIYDHPYTAFATMGGTVLLPIFKFQSQDSEFREAQFQFIMDFVIQAPSQKSELDKFFFIGRFKGLNMWNIKTHQNLDPFVDYQALDKIFKTGEILQKK